MVVDWREVFTFDEQGSGVVIIGYAPAVAVLIEATFSPELFDIRYNIVEGGENCVICGVFGRIENFFSLCVALTDEPANFSDTPVVQDILQTVDLQNFLHFEHSFSAL